MTLLDREVPGNDGDAESGDQRVPGLAADRDDDQRDVDQRVERVVVAPDRVVELDRDQGAGEARERGRDAEDEDLDDVGRGPLGLERDRRVRQRAEEAAHPAALDRHDHRRAEHRRRSAARSRSRCPTRGDRAEDAHVAAGAPGSPTSSARTSGWSNRRGTASRIPKPRVARARNSPDSRMAGIDTMAPTGTATSIGQQQREEPREVVAVGEVREGGRTDGGEREVAERDLPGDADEEAERQQQDGVGQEAGPDRQVVAHQVRDQAQHDQHRRRRSRSRTRHGAYQDLRTGSVVTTRRSASFALGVTHQGHEEDDEGDGRRQPAQPADRAGVLGGEGPGDADEQPTDEGERQAREVRRSPRRRTRRRRGSR